MFRALCEHEIPKIFNSNDDSYQKVLKESDPNIPKIEAQNNIQVNEEKLGYKAVEGKHGRKLKKKPLSK